MRYFVLAAASLSLAICMVVLVRGELAMEEDVPAETQPNTVEFEEPETKESCDMPMIFTCDYVLKSKEGGSPCSTKCWHNDWEKRDEVARFLHKKCLRWSFPPRGLFAPSGGRCYCVDCCGNGDDRC